MSILRTQKSVPYTHGFKVPRKIDIENALGKFDDNNKNSVFTEDFCNTFDSLPSPKKPSDWLAQYAEKGQTYAEFLQLSRTLHTPLSADRKTIYLTVFGQVDHTLFNIDSLIDYTQRFFQMSVKLINPFLDVQWNDEKNQWTCTMRLTDGKSRSFNLRTRYNKKPKHSQISVTAILNLLTKVVPYDARCLVALTMSDLYDDETDLFIAGLARGNCRVAAFSIYRYDPYLIFNDSNWFDCKLKTTAKSTTQIVKRQNLLLLRVCRLFTHEICHLLGIAHCIYYSCLVNGSGHLDEDFSQPLLECPVDLRKLHTLINFDIHKRYEELLEFFKMHDFLDEMKMVETKLNVIKQSIKVNSSDASEDIDSKNSPASSRMVKRKRTRIITIEKDVLTLAAAPIPEEDEGSHIPAKHLKRH